MFSLSHNCFQVMYKARHLGTHSLKVFKATVKDIALETGIKSMSFDITIFFYKIVNSIEKVIESTSTFWSPHRIDYYAHKNHDFGKYFTEWGKSLQ